MLRRLAFTSLAAAMLAASPRAEAAGPPAAPPDDDPAQTLFDRGVADMEAGRFEKACPAIEASQRLDPRPGTLFTLAECEAQRGRVATSMRYYAEYLALYRTFNDRKKVEQKDRATTSEEQLRKLELLAPRLTLTLPAGAGNDVVVKRDGDVVAELSLGAALTVDPGEHVITTLVPGGPEVEHRISLGPGDSKSLTLTVRREPLSETEIQPAFGPDRVTVRVPVAPPQPDVRAWRIGTLSAGSVAIVGLAVGAVTGILAIEQSRVVTRNCDTSTPVYTCNPVGLDAKNRMYTLGTASTVGFVAGGVGLGVGFALILATPSPPTQSPSVGKAQVSGALVPQMSLSVGGTF